MTTFKKTRLGLIAGCLEKMIFIFCFLGIISSLSFRLEAREIPEFPPPVIPIWGTGIYQGMVEKAQNFLKEKKLLEFYKEASKIRAAFLKNRRERNYEESGDELAVKEWMIYLLAKSPLLPDAEYLGMIKGRPDEEEWSDRRVKGELYEYVGYFPLEDEAFKKLLLDIYEKAGHGQPDDEALTIMARQVKEKHVIRYVGLTNLFRQMRNQAFEELKRLKYKPTPGYEMPEFPPLVIRPGTSREEEHRLSLKHLEEEVAHSNKYEDPAVKRYEHLRERILDRAAWPKPQDRSYKYRFVLTLVMTFPRDSAKVHEYLRKAGYSTDEECAEAISTIFPMTKETAYLYEDLKLEKNKGKR